MNEHENHEPNPATPMPPAGPLPGAMPAAFRPVRKRWRRRATAGIAALAIAGAAGLGGLAVGHASTGTSSSTSAASGGLWTQPNTGNDYQPGGGFGAYGFNGGQSFDNSGTDAGSATQATDKQQTGIVTIDTVVDYGEARAAGTGIVLTSDGLVLTNHHVVEGATRIKVTDESTGKSYTAEVVGTDATNDVAVLRLAGASGLATATIDKDGDPKVGDTVTTVGNAEGRGDLVAASGPVTALDQSITASDDSGSNGEQLTGLIEADVDVVSGDSGGAMLDAQGEVVGMTTAASSGTANVTGYAIDIDKALAIAGQIEAGQSSQTVHLGASAFLGVTLTSGSATIAGTVESSPAASAGLTAGDTITAVDGTRVASASQLSAALAGHKPGDKVKITWTTTGGTTHSATVTLVEGPVA